jgi:hypothetical protein
LRGRAAVVGAVLAATACGGPPRDAADATVATDTVAVTVDTATPAPAAPFDSAYAGVPDSAWIPVTGPTLIGFYPLRSNDQLEQDEGLATALDDFSYHIGTAMDSLTALGVSVHYQAGDTAWVRAGAARWRWVRDTDSADVGYVWVDARLRHASVYGVRSYADLIESARRFGATGAITPE